MAALDVKPASDEPLPDRSKGALSQSAFQKVGELVVKHEEGLGKGRVRRLGFSDKDGKAKAFAYVTHVESARAAQLAMFERLAMTSMPNDLLVKSYKIDPDGPGELCVVSVSRASGLCFVRGNVAIRVQSLDATVKARELAETMDGLLKAEMQRKP